MHERFVRLLGIRADVEIEDAKMHYSVSYGHGFTQVRALFPNQVVLRTIQERWKPNAISEFSVTPHRNRREFWLAFAIARQEQLSVEPLYTDMRDPLYPESLTYTYSSDFGQPAVYLKILTRATDPELVQITIEPTLAEGARTQARRERARGAFHRALAEVFGITPYGERGEFNLRFAVGRTPDSHHLRQLIVEEFSIIDRSFPRS